MDSSVYIERAEKFLRIAHDTSSKIVIQRSYKDSNTNALIAIAKELRAIREIMEGVTDADGKLDLCKLIKIV